MAQTLCELYGDYYDDRIEDTHPPTAGDKKCAAGEDWCPGTVANHKSLAAFQKELKNKGITLSTSKIKKILITGGRWTTQRSRNVQEAFQHYTKPIQENGKGLTEAEAIRLISKDMGISIVSVSVNLPYSNVVYNLEQKSSNAKRCARYKERKRGYSQNDPERLAVLGQDGKKYTQTVKGLIHPDEKVIIYDLTESVLTEIKPRRRRKKE